MSRSTTPFNMARTSIDFVGKHRRWFWLSGIMLAISLVGFLFRGGLNLGLEFTGGLAVVAENPNEATVEEVRSEIAVLGYAGARIQLIDDGTQIRVQTEAVSPDQQEELVEAIEGVTGAVRENISIDSVGPTFGALVARRALTALLVFLGVAILFIAWRLQWKMALAGIAALVHDLILTVGIYGITGFEVTPSTVVAILTILGYSLYDTVVVFDRVEEIENTLGEKETISTIVNRAMNQMLVRSINTSLTSLLPVGSLLFVGSFLFGAASLQDFALALFVGIAAGTYSSIFVAAPLLGMWKEREDTWTARRHRLERKQDKPSVIAATAPTGGKEPTRTEPDRVPTGVGVTGAPPKPPKRKRRR